MMALCAILLLSLTSFAQRKAVDVRVDTSSEIPRYGPNRFFFIHGLVQLGAITGPQDYSMEVNPWSWTLTYGARFKWKLWSWNAFVTDVGYRFDNYSLKKRQPGLPPFHPDLHQRTRVSVNNFSLVFCDRVNFGRRGNVLGNYLDLGVYGDWNFFTGYVYVDQYYLTNPVDGGQYKQKVHVSKLSYISQWNYGLTVRYGNDRFGVFARYRLNDFVTNPLPSTHYHDLPKLAVGIELYQFD